MYVLVAFVMYVFIYYVVYVCLSSFLIYVFMSLCMY